MTCININISKYTSSGRLFYKYQSSYLSGTFASGSGGVGNLTDAEIKEIAIQNTLAYLGGTFKNVYGRPMIRTDICGQIVIPPVIPPIVPPIVPPTEDYTNIIIVVIIIILFIILSKGK